MLSCTPYQAVMAYNSLRLEHEEMKNSMAALRKGQDGIQVKSEKGGGAGRIRGSGGGAR